MHRQGTPPSVRVAIVTVSDTRTEADDASGALLQDRLVAAGHLVTSYAILRDDPASVRDHVRSLLTSETAQAVITTGGTGIAARDSTYEAIASLLEKRLDGFGELFRMLSYAEIGAAAMLSRAVAGTAEGGVIFALPGSVDAVRLGIEKLVLPELGHAVALARR